MHNVDWGLRHFRECGSSGHGNGLRVDRSACWIVREIAARGCEQAPGEDADDTGVFTVDERQQAVPARKAHSLQVLLSARIKVAKDHEDLQAGVPVLRELRD